MAALAAATERVTLGPLVACLAFHPPGLVARMAAAIDEISGGRFVLGVGSGWNEEEFRAFGLPFDYRASPVHRELRDHPPPARGRARDERGPLLAGRRRRAAATAGAHDPDHDRRERAEAARCDPALRRQLEHVVRRLRQPRRGLRRPQRRDQRGRRARGRDPARGRAQRLRPRRARRGGAASGRTPTTRRR